jgi:hypothetical protein
MIYRLMSQISYSDSRNKHRESEAPAEPASSQGLATSLSRTPSRVLWSLPLALSFLIAGCSEELGPVPIHVVTVHGSVRESGRPITRGWIEFFPVDGTVGNLRSARLAPDGSFTVDGVAVGRNLVRLVNIRSASKAIEQIFGRMDSPIRRVIVKNSNAPVEIDLYDEALRYQQSQERSPARQSAKTGNAR